ncbi:hypothetical protein STRTUCAR8_06068 [Streptomyces turgidiscabies Car8]|uniref:Uncharacterized protein n=1 Tax=Streptomyces turgidiscabies (strain Car8) TaxID=698760 RepID=L7F7V4_STRT8|nr:hypothetical protein STRTUCAR8_06068 [Streptomyces turgidiscabies Car8]
MTNPNTDTEANAAAARDVKKYRLTRWQQGACCAWTAPERQLV